MISSIKFIINLFLVIFFLNASALGDVVKPSYTVIRSKEIIIIDGSLDEPVWSQGEAISGFVQKDPRPNDPATHRTEVRVALDDDFIYIGAYLFDSAPDSIAKQIVRRDGWGYVDWFAVGIDSYNDKRTCYGFWASPSGSMRDMLHYNDTETDKSWDAVWETKSVIQTDGWSAEMKIPLSQLRYNASSGQQEWGINFYRRTARSGEECFWAPILMETKGFVSQFGTLKGIRLKKQKKRIEFLPYVASTNLIQPGNKNDPFWQSNNVSGNLGVDVKLGLGSNFTLTGTINPDFGQVEADPADLNLSAFETFFDERRPFFLEGTDIFQFGKTRGVSGLNSGSGSTRLFYSRRIGRSPRGEIIESGIQFENYPKKTNIISALKLSGRTANGLSVGILSALTNKATASYIDSSGYTKSQIIEPYSYFTVLRLRQDIGSGRFVIGGFMTHQNQRLSNDYLRKAFLKDAFVTGLDFEYALPDPSWVVSGVVSRSHIFGNQDVVLDIQESSAHYFQQPGDNIFVDSLKTSLNGVSTEFSIAKISGKNLKGSLTFSQLSPGYNVNELGYMRSANSKTINSSLKYEDYTPGRFWQIFSFSFGSYQNWDYDFKNVNSGIWMENWIRLNSWNVLSWDYRNSFGGTNRVFTRGGPVSARPTWNKVGLKFETDRRKKVNSFIRLGYRLAEDNEFDKSFGSGFGLRPNTKLDLEVEFYLRNEFDTDQYIDQISDEQAINTYGKRYIFSDISNDTKGMTFEADMIHSPTVSFQFFMRPELGHYQYRGLKEFNNPGGYDFIYYEENQIREIDENTVEITPSYAADANSFTLSKDFIRGFNFISIRSNFVVKWEFKPGSSMFLVWQHERNHYEITDEKNLRISAGVDKLLGSDYVSTFMIKLTHWFSS